MNNIKKSDLIGLGPNSTLIKEYKNSLPKLTIQQRDTLIGLLLGDANIQRIKTSDLYRIRFEWSNDSKSYVNHIYELFEAYIITPPYLKSRKQQSD